MKSIEKTVFISYRHANGSWALAIFQNLKQQGYDVFFDFKSIGSGDFEQVILENVRARAHFLVLLTPSAFERCDEPEDWLRREIETALDSKRNIVPLMLEGFDFDAAVVRDHLKGKLATLKRYNALRVTVDYFEEAMTRLREQYLDIPIETVLHPPSVVAQVAVKKQQAAANEAPAVVKNELIAQQWFEKGYESYSSLANVLRTSFGEAIEYFGRAIGANPLLVEAYKYRGIARFKNKPGLFTPNWRTDQEGAIRDFAEAIRLRPDDVEVYYWRAEAYEAFGNLEDAAGDYSKIIQLTWSDTKAYYRRAKIREKLGDVDGAIDDFSKGTRLYNDYSIKMLRPPEEVTLIYHESSKIIRDLKRKSKSCIQSSTSTKKKRDRTFGPSGKHFEKGDIIEQYRHFDKKSFKDGPENSYVDTKWEILDISDYTVKLKLVEGRYKTFEHIGSGWSSKLVDKFEGVGHIIYLGASDYYKKRFPKKKAVQQVFDEFRKTTL